MGREEEEVATETTDTNVMDSTDDIALAERMREKQGQVLTELRKIIIGQDDVVDQALITLYVGGNSMITGVPGLAKTLLIRTLAEVLDLEFSRIQFTPDLMPSDITGTDIIQEDPETGARHLVFTPGPVFTNILLADEINRTPPKTQSALLEAMEEHRVTVQGKTYVLNEPFFVFATQNPIELEGTYPLPEAQLDRFMFNIIIDYMPEDEELDVVRATTVIQDETLEHALTGEEIIEFQRLVRRVPVSDAVMRYAVDLARTTRPIADDAPDFIKKWVEYGASVRASQYLILAGKARALMQGRYHVNFEDLQSVAKPIFRHRILTNFHAEAERVSTDDITDQLLKAVPVPASGM
jgi:MoxR-like ATPase